MMSVAQHLRLQGAWCERLGSPFTAQLMERAADDCEAGGIVEKLTRDWPTDPHVDALGLRLAGALHSAVLLGLDDGLAATYPKRERAYDIDRVWRTALAFLAERENWVMDFLRSPPQTNEVGRSGVLAPGFLWLAARAPQPFRMLELGASAGLNSNWDRFRYTFRDSQQADAVGPLIATEIDGDAPGWRDIRIAERRASDRAPIDPLDEDAAARLRAYIWPDQFERLERLNAAIEVARSAPVRVEQGRADEWLVRQLACGLTAGTTVIFHSIFLQYPTREEQERIAEAIEAAGAAADAEHQLAWVCFEPEAVLGGCEDSTRILLRARTWAGGSGVSTVLGEADPHGKRLRWLAGRD